MKYTERRRFIQPEPGIVSFEEWMWFFVLTIQISPAIAKTFARSLYEKNIPMIDNTENGNPQHISSLSTLSTLSLYHIQHTCTFNLSQLIFFSFTILSHFFRKYIRFMWHEHWYRTTLRQQN